MGSAWMLLAGLCFALMSAVVKQAGQWFSGAELVFYRSVFAFVLIAVPLLWRHRLAGVGVLAGAHLPMHLRRGLVGFIALAAFFHAIVHLPMSMAVTLNYASPLFLALLMPWQLKERPGLWQYASVALGFAGVVMLLRPWEAGADLGAGLIGLFSGVMAAFAYINVRLLGRLHEPEWRTVFWFSAVCLVGAAGLASLDGWHPLRLETLPWLLLLGMLATLGQLAMTRAYRTGRTALVASFAFSTVVFSGLLDAAVFDENMPINAWAGMAVIVLAGIWAAQLSFGEKR
ncbi:MAG: DMT family transporter [Pseudomonadota bacterium]